MSGGVLPDPLAGFHFAGDWLSGRGAAREFLPWTGAGSGWNRALDAREARPVAPLDSEAVAEIERFNRGWGNEAGARLAPLLADSRTLVVVTGQQPNLLASPLYVLLKALSAWALARRLARLGGANRPVVPVFWIASDDADFHELRDCRMVSEEGRQVNLGELVTRGEAPGASPAYEWTFDPATVERLVQTVEELFPCEAWNTARGLVRHALSGERPGFESAFARTLAALLGEEHGLVFVAPRMGWIRRAQRSLLEAEFGQPGLATRLLAERGAQMAAAGYAPQISRDRKILNAFYLSGRQRLRLVARGADEIVAEDPATHAALHRFSRTGLLEELNARPERFSPNVVTRPLVQDSLLPTVAYVGGPGEVSYLAQLSPVYAAFGVMQPAIVLRASATLVPARALREMTSLGVEPRPGGASSAGGAGEPDMRPVGELLEEQLLALAPETGPLLARVREIAAETDRQLAELRRAANIPRHPHLAPALEKTAFSIHRSLERLQRRVWRQVATEGGEPWRCYVRATAHLQVSGPPQERALAPHCFLDSRPTPADLAAELVRKLSFEETQSQMVLLD